MEWKLKVLLAWHIFFFFFSGYHALVLWAVPPWLDLQILGIPVATSCKLVLRMKLANWFHGIVFLWGAIYLLEGLCSFSSVAIQMNLSWWDSHTFLLLVGNSRPRCLQGWFLPRSMREASSGSTPGVLPWGHSWRRPLEPQLETGPGNTTVGGLPGSTFRTTKSLSKVDLEVGFGLKEARDEERKIMVRSPKWQTLHWLCSAHVDFRPSQQLQWFQPLRSEQPQYDSSEFKSEFGRAIWNS